MPLIKTLNAGTTTVCLWKIDETEAELCALIGTKGAQFGREALESFKSLKRRLEWLAVRACVAQVLGPDADIVYRKIGEPALRGSSWRISISHTRGFVAVALHPSHYVGVDIQTVEPKILNLAGHIASPDEIAALPAGVALREKALTLIFSLKESLYKALDIDFLDYRYGMETFGLDASKNEDALPMVYRRNGCEYFFKASFRQIEGLCLTLVTDEVLTPSRLLRTSHRHF